ncbi:MAG: hypothetical protein WCE52_06330 [Candidatus Acidiferrum sp.]
MRILIVSKHEAAGNECNGAASVAGAGKTKRMDAAKTCSGLWQQAMEQGIKLAPDGWHCMGGSSSVVASIDREALWLLEERP